MTIDPSLTLEEVLRRTKRYQLYVEPILPHNISSPWLALKKGLHKKLHNAIGSSPYRAFEGIGLTPREIFLVNILDNLDKFVIVENIDWPRSKKKVKKKITTKVEKEVLYLVIFGKNIHKWAVVINKAIYAPILCNPKTGKLLKEDFSKVRFPHAYSYFSNYKEELISSANYKHYGKGNPFYFIYRLEKRIFAPFKVIWREVGTEVNACVISKLNDPNLGEKIPIPDYTCIFIPFENESEAYYVCGILNSCISQLVTSYLHLHPDPHVLEHLKIPKYNQSIQSHKKISELSKKAHEIAKEIYERKREELKSELEKIEDEIDKLVAQLYGITDEELNEIKKCLRILKEGEIEEEEVEEEKEEVQVNFNANVKPLTPGFIEVSVLNPQNQKVRIEIKLPEEKKKEKLETNQKEETFKISIKPLKPGEYKIPYKVIVDGEIKEESEFVIYVEQEKKVRKKDSLDDMLDELLG